MRYSQLFGKTVRRAPQDARLASHQLLFKAGFIRRFSTGRWGYLPLGMRVWKKIKQIIEDEMDKIGCQRLVVPTLHPLEIWQATKRDQAFGEEMLVVDDHHGARFAIGATAEGMMLELVKMFRPSYKDLPIDIYQFSQKFRDDKRPRGGLMRVREFMMKDAYNFCATEKQLMKGYQKYFSAYQRIAKKLGLTVTPVLADSGAIGGSLSHEFMYESADGDQIYFVCDQCGYSANIERCEFERAALNPKEKVKNVEAQDGDGCSQCKKGLPAHRRGQLKKKKGFEWSHTFKLDQFYSQGQQGFYVDEKGQQQLLWMGSYGIGLDRSMALIAEAHHDHQGLIWPKAVAPFQAHLIQIKNEKLKIKNFAEKVYQQLLKAGIEILYDDRDVSAGVKFSDADLIGIPVRLVISEKTLRQDFGELSRAAQGKLEWKNRGANKTELLSLQETLKRLKS